MTASWRPFAFVPEATEASVRDTLPILLVQRHKAELYSFWTWIPAFPAASDAVHAARTGNAPNARVAALIGFGVIAVGGIGCVWGGLVADRIGRARLVSWAMGISGSCALAIGLAWGQSWWILVPLALVWGFFVIADSAQFSVLVTETVPPHAAAPRSRYRYPSAFCSPPSPSNSFRHWCS